LVNVSRKQTKNDTNKLITIAFKIIPIFHNKLLATPKTKTILALLSNFGPHQATQEPQLLWAGI
jgi:hypothetical protein